MVESSVWQLSTFFGFRLWGLPGLRRPQVPKPDSGALRALNTKPTLNPALRSSSVFGEGGGEGQGGGRGGAGEGAGEREGGAVLVGFRSRERGWT